VPEVSTVSIKKGTKLASVNTIYQP